MASIKDLRKRISSTKNTQQTTKAMKMVSAAKLRRAQEAIVAHRPYARETARLLKLTAEMIDHAGGSKFESPLLTGHTRDSVQGGKPKLLLILVSSDRGLCGGFNASIIKGATRWISEQASQYGSIDLAFVGKKAFEYFKYRDQTGKFYEEFGRRASFDLAKKVSGIAIERFLAGEYQEVRIIYNEFKNAITQKVLVERFLPVLEDPFTSIEGEAIQASSDVDLYLAEPSAQFLLESLLKKHFATQAFRILLESQASEHGARMSAMENATKNAGDMIKKLTLAYNKQRQAGITKELLEIISGSESQKNA